MVPIGREQHRMADVAPLLEPLLAHWVHPYARRMRALFALQAGDVHQIRGLVGPDPLPQFRDFTWLTEARITAEFAAVAELPCRPAREYWRAGASAAAAWRPSASARPQSERAEGQLRTYPICAAPGDPGVREPVSGNARPEMFTRVAVRASSKCRSWRRRWGSETVRISRSRPSSRSRPWSPRLTRDKVSLRQSVRVRQPRGARGTAPTTVWARGCSCRTRQRLLSLARPTCTSGRCDGGSAPRTDAPDAPQRSFVGSRACSRFSFCEADRALRRSTEQGCSSSR
jgi:hypothetical protein